MGVLARGSVTDRPWGMTLGALGLRGLSGQLTLAGQYRVAFEQGVVVGAYSPLANDAAVRLALTGNLITSSQVSDITRRIAAAPLRDEVEVLAEACRLGPDHAQRLRRRLVAQRAARTFAIDAGEFVVEDQVSIAVVPGSELDVRTIVFLGARNNLSEDRLASELAQLGVWFKLKPEAVADLPQYGFTEDEKPLLQLLVQGANLSDLEYANASLGARVVRAVTYSLAVCGACETSATAGPAIQRAPSTTAPPQSAPRAMHPTVPPQTQLRGATPAPTTPPETKQHKTAPLGSRSPAAGSNPPASHAAGSTPPANQSAAGSTPPANQPATGPVPTRGTTVAPATSRAPTRPQPPTPDGLEPPTVRNPAFARTMTPGEPTPTVRRSDPNLGNTAYTVPGRTPSNPPYAQPSSTNPPPSSSAPSYSQPTTFGVDPATGRVPLPEQDPAFGRTPTPNDLTMGRVPTPTQAPVGPRTITQSSGVPREADAGNSSGANARTGSFQAARDRSPSGGVNANDRSPSGGVPRAGTATSRPGSQTGLPPMSRTRTNNTGPRATTDGVARARTSSSQSMRAFSTQAPPTRAPTPAKLAKPAGMRRPKQSTAATMEIDALLQKKIPMLDNGVDYFTLFGLPIGASADDVRSTYFMLARKLHPDRLAAIGIDDDDRQAQRLMACINEAFTVLNDPARREEYLSILNRGGEAAVRAEEQKADELAMKVMRAEEEFRQGEMALRREQIAQAVTHFQMAVELQPNESEYQAMLAWAQFAAATDKNSVASQTRKALVRAAEANSESPTAHFYLGRVERMLGREKEALYCFYQVLRVKPNHSEARSEARILEQRLKARK